MSFTIPARLARPSIRSQSPVEARQRVIQLYRDWCRGVRPSAIRFYPSNDLHLGPGNHLPLRPQRLACLHTILYPPAL